MESDFLFLGRTYEQNHSMMYHSRMYLMILTHMYFVTAMEMEEGRKQLNRK